MLTTQCTVLIVDNDPDVLKTLYRYTESQGFTTRAVTTLREARTRLQDADILVLDESVNGGDVSSGMLLEEWVHKGHAPVCLLTENADPDVALCMLRDGAYNVLVKPVSMEIYSVLLQRYRRYVYYATRCKEMETEMSDLFEKMKEENSKELKKVNTRFWVIAILVVVALLTGNIENLSNLFALF